MREGKGERDRRGGREAGACPTNKTIVPRPCQKTAVFFSIQNTWKRFQHFIRLVGSCCSLALIYLVVSVLRALDGSGKLVVGGEVPPASRGDCRPWAHSEIAGSHRGNTTET